MKEPLISIYTPTYNRNDILRSRALNSVLNQTYKNWEWIIVHDGLEDHDLGLILDSYDDKRIKYYKIPREKNYPDNPENNWLAGPVAPSNYALDHCNGEWLCRLDDDDTWEYDHLEVLLKFALEGEYDFVSAQYERYEDHERKIIDGAWAHSGYYRDEMNPNLPDVRIGGIQTVLYHKSLQHIRYNPDCWKKAWNRVNDIDFVVQVFNSGAKMGYLEKSIGFYYPRPNNDKLGLEAYYEEAER